VYRRILTRSERTGDAFLEPGRGDAKDRILIRPVPLAFRRCLDNG